MWKRPVTHSTALRKRWHIPTAIALEEQPSLWVPAGIVAGGATWVMIFGIAKLLHAFI